MRSVTGPPEKSNIKMPEPQIARYVSTAAFGRARGRPYQGPKSNVTQWPVELFVAALGYDFTYFWRPEKLGIGRLTPPPVGPSTV